jgi:AraC-like DNA-binding protein
VNAAPGDFDGCPAQEACRADDLPRAERNRRIAEAHLEHGYMLAEIARHCGLHDTTISKIVQAETSQFKT